MKTSRKIYGILGAAALAVALSSCDGMWLGVDSDAGYGGPYYSDPGWANGYFGPALSIPAVAPPSQPVLGGLGPVVVPSANNTPSRPSGAPSQPNVSPSQPSGPSMSPSVPSNPEGVTGSPAVSPGGKQRPGNMGRP